MINFFINNSKINKVRSAVLYILLFSNSLPLIIHAYLGTYSRLYGDDFCYFAQLHSKGFFAALKYYYTSLTGRYSDLVVALGTISFDNNYIYGTGIFIFLWLIILVYFIHLLIGTKKKHYLFSFLLASTIIYVSIELLPDKSFRRVISNFSHTWDRYPSFYEVLYWKSGRQRFITPMILGTILSCIIFFLFNPDNKLNKFINTNILTFFGSVLAFIASGFGETYFAIQTTTLTIILLIVFYFNSRKKKLLRNLGIIWFSSLFSICIYLYSPGTETRMGFFQQPSDIMNLIGILFKSISSTIFIIFKWPGNLINLLSVVCISLYIGTEIRISGLSKKSIEFFIKILPFSVLIVLVSSFLPAVYALSKGPPPRVLIFSIYITIFLFSIWFLLIGNLVARKKKIVLMKYSKPILVLFFLLFSVNSLRDSIKLYSLKHDFQSFSSSYDKREEAISEAKSKGLESLNVAELHHFIGGRELSNDSNQFWVNECICYYYGINLEIEK